jgi:putative transposase
MESMKHKRACQYRFYPTDAQKNILARTFGCCRVVYNWALRERTDAYSERQERLYSGESSARLTHLKKQPDYCWLNEVSSVTLQQELRHLEKAFVNFFEGRADYPTLHTRHRKQSATYAANAFTWENATLTLAKMNEPLAIRWSRSLPDGCKPSSVTISKDGAERYFVSFLIEQEIETLPVVVQTIGADLGVKSFVVLSNGEAIGNPQFIRRDEKRLARAQRKHARKKKGSKNKNKARVKVAKVHARIADRRRDFQHKLSTRLIHENQVICVESLAVKNMVKNHCLAFSVA